MSPSLWLRPLRQKVRCRTSSIESRGCQCSNRRAFRPHLEQLEERVLPSTVKWINAAGGDWDVASNWNTGKLPGASDDVVIPFFTGGLTITHIGSNADSIKSLTSQEKIDLSNGSLSIAKASTINNAFSLSGGTLNGAGTVTVSGLLSWTSGTMSGSGQTVASGGLQLNSVSTDLLLDGRTLINTATATWVSGFMEVADGAVIQNQTGATFDIQSDSSFSLSTIGGADATFTNAGTVTKSGGTSSTRFDNVIFNNTGTLDVQSGIVSLDDGGISSGAFTAETGAEVDLGGGTYTLQAGASQAGAGLFHILNGATLTTDDAVGLQNLTLDGGTLTGSGTVTVGGMLSWLFGTMSGTGQTVANGGLQLNSGFGTMTLDGRTLVNTSAATWVSGFMAVADGAVIDNQAGATFDIQSDSSFSLSSIGGADAAFNNDGTVTKSGGISNSDFGNVIFNNTGTLDVQSATMTLDDGGTGTGTFKAEAGATLAFGLGTYDLNTGSILTGAGTVDCTNGTVNLNGADTTGIATIQLDGGTLNLNIDVPLQNLTINSGSLTGTGNASVSGLLTWAGGTMSGSGQTVANGGLQLNSAFGTMTLDGRTLVNTAAATWVSGFIAVANGAAIQNQAGATWDLQSDAGFGLSALGGADATFSNDGTFTKSGGTSTTTFSNVIFNNTGTLDVQSGTVALDDGGTSSGAFTIEAGAEIDAGVGLPYTLEAGASELGAGLLNITNGATLTAAADVGLQNLEISGGTLTGSGTVTVNGVLNWILGTMSGSGQTVVNAGLQLNSAFGTITLDGRTLVNTATATWASGFMAVADGAVIDNQAGATFDVQSDSGFFLSAIGGADATFNNAGTFMKSGGTGNTDVANVIFNNTGRVDVKSGTVTLEDGGTGSGSFAAEARATLAFGSGTYTLTANSSVVGSGTIGFVNGGTALVGGIYGVNGTTEISSGTVNFGVSAKTTALTLDGGTLTGSGTVTVTGLLTWSTGTMSGIGQTVASGGFQLTNGGSDLQLDGRTLVNTATATWVSGFMEVADGAVIDNQAGATFDIQSDSGFSLSTIGGADATFNNAGTVTKSGGSSTSSFANVIFNNTGTLDVESATVSLDDGTPQLSGSTLTGGTWIVGPGASLVLPDNITTNAATLQLGKGATFTAINSLMNNSGSFALLAGATFATAGDLANSGTLALGAGATLTVNGNFTQNPSGTLQVEIGGPPAAGPFGQLLVTGAAALDGTLGVQLVNGFGPSVGATYPVVTFASESGNFASFAGFTAGQVTLFSEALTGTSVDVLALVNAPDLAFSSVTVPAQGSAGQDSSISYTVQNLGDATATGDWFDSVYLTSGSVVDPSAALVGRVHHVGDVAGHTSYTETLTAPLPGVVTGSYHVFVIADSRGLVPDTNRVNNSGASTSTINLSVPSLTLGTPVTGFLANGQDLFYRVDLLSGQDVHITATFGAADAGELYVRYLNVPDTANFDQLAFTPGQTQEQVLLGGTQAGSYYILLHGREGAGSGQTFSLVAQGTPLSVTGVSPVEFGNGLVSLTINGTDFTRSTTASLLAPDGTPFAAEAVVFKDRDTLFATFDLTGSPTGSFSVRLNDGGQSATDPNAVTVFQNLNENRVLYSMSAPSYVRDGTLGIVTITYRNVGNTDIAAPLLQLTSFDAPPLTPAPGFVQPSVQSSADLLRLPDQVNFSGSTVQFLGINNSGLAGILPAGAGGQITIFFQASSSAPDVNQLNFSLGESSDDQPMDWASYKDAARPTTISPDAWDAIWGNFLNAVGTTVGDFHRVMAQDASYLSELGTYTYDVGKLIAFEIGKANDYLPSQTLSSVADVGTPAPGLSLTFGRSFLQPISGRYHLGRLGRGWVDNWDFSAATDAQGNVFIHEGAGLRIFTKLANGTYEGTPGDMGMLMLSGGAYSLHERDGTVFAFNPDGTLNFDQDTNGNRITAGYTSGLLTTLTQSNGEQMTLAYNAQGRISQVSDAFGRITTYSYDASSEHLLSVTTPQGTTQYTYVTGQGPAEEHALASIAFADGMHQFFSYDNQGRLAGQSRDGGAEPITYAYGQGATLTATDASDASTTILYNEFSQPGEVIDPLGRASQFQYDANQMLSRFTSSDGSFYTYGYDSRGNLIRQVDPLCNVTNLSFNNSLNRLTGSTDPKGNTTNYSYDGSGNLLAITYANGSQEQFSYDPLGNLVESINRRNDAILYHRNAAGQLTRKDFADGTHIDYIYDAHGNLVSASDSTGTTALQYDSADRLMQITYPSGRFLHFTYDAGGRRTQSIDQSGFTVNYQYDAVGRLAGLTDGNGAMIVTYTYDSVGRLSRKDMGNGTFTTYDYDLAGQLLQLVNHAPDGTVNSRFDNTYDQLGRRTTETTLDGEWTYSYDAIGELTHAVFVSNNPASIPNQDLQYVYDAAGNRVSTTINGVTTAYTTNNLNQYTSVGSIDYTYDADGNLITQTNGADLTTTYTYNDENRLTSVSGPGQSQSFSYDAFGNLNSTTDNGQRTNYLIDPSGLGDIVGEYDGSGNLIAHYTQGIGLVSQENNHNLSAYYDFGVPHEKRPRS
jgi:YD repeat-containing protein